MVYRKVRYKDYTGPLGEPLEPLVGDIEGYIERLKQVFGKFKEVKVAYLFGSHARKVVHKRSDVDIAIVAPDIELGEYKRLWSAIREVLSTERFDLVVLDGKPVSFRFEVIKEGRPIYALSEDSLNVFELGTIKVYLDTKPLRSLYADILNERVSGI